MGGEEKISVENLCPEPPIVNGDVLLSCSTDSDPRKQWQGERKSSDSCYSEDSGSLTVDLMREEEKLGILVFNASQNASLAFHWCSSTSTVRVRDTITSLDKAQVIYCIAAIIQAQAFDDLALPPKEEIGMEFKICVNLPAEFGGPLNGPPSLELLNHEASQDAQLWTKLVNEVVPTVDTVYRFIAYVSDHMGYSPECNILALIYLNRLTGRHNLPLTMANFRGLWIACIILAHKVWDDVHVRLSNIAKFLPGVSKEELKALEFAAFKLMNFTTLVKPSVYAKYYFELRQLYLQIMGINAQTSAIWALEPLSIAEGKRLEYRSSLCRTIATKTSGPSTPLSTRSSSSSSADATPNKMKKQSSCDSRVIGLAKTLEDVTLTSTARFVIS